MNRHPARAPRLLIVAAAAAAWACGSPSPDPAARELVSASPTHETRFSRRVLVEGLSEPIALDFDPRGRVYWIERAGAVRRYDGATGQVDLLGTIPTRLEGETGLIGILLDRDFESTRHVYLYYSAPEAYGEREMRLARFALDATDRLDLGSEVVLMRWPYDLASHFGGGMTWDAEGNLYLSTGDNTNAQEYAPLRSTQPGGRGEDSQRTAGNTNDLRGKILRVRPRADGSYGVPAGNLFAPGTPGTRPEIYVMGTRNPWRLSIDSRTGYLHWGDVGPDAGVDSAGVGPMGYDEFNVAKRAGNYGWPFLIGYNLPYHRFDDERGVFGPPFDPARPVNASPNNTGLRELPPARPALVAYPYGVSGEYPQLGSGGRAAAGGPILRRADFRREGAVPFPEEHEGRWFATDYVRGWIMLIRTDEARERVVSLERFLPEETLFNPIDLDFGPDGALYVLEYAPEGQGKLSRIEYNPGNRAPRVAASVDRPAGATPLRITLSARGTVDHDGDRLRYRWVVTPAGGGEAQRFDEPDPTLTLTRPGAYTATLSATDPSGAEGRAEVRIVAGNEPPRLALEVLGGNRSFYFPESVLEYRVRVSDREDGSLGSGIPPDSVRVTAEYVPSVLTPEEVEQARTSEPDGSVRHLRAYAIMDRSDCRACHTEDTPLVGPAFRDVARRYRTRPDAEEYLAGKIIGGSSGVWGAAHMPPHPGLTPAEATTLARYVLSLEGSAAPERLGVQGRYPTPVRTTRAEAGPVAAEAGSYVVRAAYTDRGAPGAAPLTAREILVLRHPRLPPEAADTISEGTSYAPSRWDPMFIVDRSGAFLGFRQVDLTGIERIEVGALTRFYNWSHFRGGTVEVRLDSPTGPRLGEPVAVTPPEGLTGPVFFGTERMEKPVPIDVRGASGVHDLFLVFTNPRAGEADALLILTGIEFVPRGTAR